MIKIYTDAAFNLEHNTASYCIVIVNENTGEKTWQVDQVAVYSSTDAECAGLGHALRIAASLRQGGEICVVHTDCDAAIRTYQKKADRVLVKLQHVKGHLLDNPNVVVTEDIKRQHWCDIMANYDLRKTLDLIKHERIVKV